MKFALIVFLLVLFSGCISNINKTENLHQENFSKGNLIGNVVVLNIYVDTENGNWTENALDERQNKVKEALNWLSDQADKSNSHIEFQSVELFTQSKKFRIDEKTKYSDNQNGWFEEVLANLGFQNQKAILTRYKILGVDSVAIILHVNQVFTSHTTFIPAVSVISAKQPVEFNEDYPTRAATVAHELLHQYGANHTIGPEMEIMAPGAGRENIFENFIGVETGEQIGWKIIDESLWDDLIRFLASRGYYDVALGKTEKALEINPNYKKGHFLFDLGNIYYLKQEYNKSVEAYNKALEQDPENQEIIMAKKVVKNLADGKSSIDDKINAMKNPSSEEEIKVENLENYLQGRSEDKIPIWVVYTEGCVSEFFKYGENLEEKYPFDDQRYHGFAKYKINLPKSEIKNFAKCLQSGNYKVIVANDAFAYNEIRILKK